MAFGVVFSIVAARFLGLGLESAAAAEGLAPLSLGLIRSIRNFTGSDSAPALGGGAETEGFTAGVGAACTAWTAGWVVATKRLPI